MVDDNVSFTDANGTAAGGGGAGGQKQSNSAMLDLIGTLNNKKDEESSKDGKSGKKKGKKGKKGKTKKVRKADRFESQNFLFRIEGSMFCAGIIVGVAVLIVFIIGAIVFSVVTRGHIVDYMWPWWDSRRHKSS